MNSTFYVIPVACLGFLLASFIRYKKVRKTEKLVCPLKGRCEEVVHSEYATIVGIPVECLGMTYYAIVAIGYGYLLYVEHDDTWISQVLFFLSSGAFCFSLYLTFIQVALLRKLCTWCLLSASFCMIIFLLLINKARF